jgi:meiotic recombination protein SPO11
MSEVKDESDFDMLFDDSPDISDNQDVISSVGPQLSRQNQHSGVITQIEAVFETVADALLNERADVTISLASISSNEPRDISVKTPKAVFTFPGKTANDAWRFCR